MAKRGMIRGGCLAALALAMMASVPIASSAGGAVKKARYAPGVTAKTITVGTTTALTGPVASYCDPLTKGAAAWIAHVNETGGVYGRRINDVVLDDQYSATQALANANTLVSKPIFAFFAGCGTIAPPQVQTIAQPKNIPYLFPLASVTPAKNIYSILPSYAQQMTAQIKWAFAKYGSGSVYMLNVEIPGYQSTSQAAQAAVAAGGGTWLGEQDVTAGQVDLTTPILAMKATQPQYVILMLTAGDSARALSIMEAQGAMPSKKILSSSTTPTLAFMNTAPSYGAGIIMMSPVAPFDRPLVRSCLQVFAEANPAVQADGTSIVGCVQAQALQLALKEAGKNPTRRSLMAAIDKWHNQKISTAVPPLSYTTLNEHGFGESKMYVLTPDSSGTLNVLGTVPIN